MGDRETLDRELRAGLAQMKSGRAATLALVESLDEAEAHRVPAGGGWSVVEVLDHLLKTDEIYRLQFLRAFELKDAGREPVIELGLDELNTRPSLVPASAMTWLEVPLRLLNRVIPGFVREYLTGVVVIPFKTPDAARPAADLEIAGLRERLRASAEETERMLDRDVEGVVVDHTLLGRNTVPGLLRILARHEDRHRGQISRVLAEAGEPAGREEPASAGSARPAPAPPPANGRPPVAVEALEADAESALKTGRQIVGWWRDKTLLESLELSPIGSSYPPYREVRAFFDSILFLGQMEPTSIMGCLQTHRFKRRRPPAAEASQHLETFIDELFLSRCLQPRPDGSPGGFRYVPLAYRDEGGPFTAAGPEESSGLDLSAFRRGRELVVLRVDILDFLRASPATARLEGVLPGFATQSAYVAIHPDLAQEPEKAPPGVMAQRSFGYAFLPRTVSPTIAGFGPGKFGAAVKQWRFLLYVNGDVEVRVAFLVAPRSERVLDLAGFDPVYASISLGDLMSFRTLHLRERGHDALDHVFLDHHWQVHAGVVDGLREVWEGQRWTPAFGAW